MRHKLGLALITCNQKEATRRLPLGIHAVPFVPSLPAPRERAAKGKSRQLC